MKKAPRNVIILHNCTKNHDHMIICYAVPDIWCETDVTVIFHFGLLFAFLGFNKIFDSFSPNDLNESLYIDALITFSLIFLLDFHSTEGWRATRKHGVTRKRRKWWKAYEKAKLKEPRDKRCLLTLDLQPLRS